MSPDEDQVTHGSVGPWKDTGFHPACNRCHYGTIARNEMEIQHLFCKDHFGYQVGCRQCVVGELVGRPWEGYGSGPSKNDALGVMDNQNIISRQMLERCHQSFIQKPCGVNIKNSHSIF